MTTQTPPVPDTRRDRPRPGTRRTGVLTATAAVVLVTVAVTAAATGMFATPMLGDQGLFTRVGLPVARAVFDLAAVLTLGTAALAGYALPLQGAVRDRAARLLIGSAGVWAVAAGVGLVLGASDVAGLPVSHPGFGTVLVQYATQIESGKLATWSLALTALLALILPVLPRTGAVFGWGTALSAAALVPTALAGHAAGPGHEIVGSAWWLHGVGLGLWVGGLIALTVLRPVLPDPATAAARYSALALAGFGLVAFSGVAGTIPRLNHAADLVTTGYGRLLTAKTILILLLGAAGWWHRRRTITQLAGGSAAPFWRLVAVEGLVMGAAVGLAVVLGRSAPPVPEELSADPSPGEIVTGQPLPPPLTQVRLLTETTWDVLWIAVVACLLGYYLWAVRTLRRRGDTWPVHRTVVWVLGCLALLYITCGGMAVYARIHFSIHMLDHMALSMVAPPLLVLGAPVTLLLRVSPARRDGSRGVREWVLRILESRFVRVLSHPVTAALLFTGSLVVFYYTDLFGLALRTHLGHELMMVHFVGAGYLFAESLIGVDPAPNRFPYPLRILVLFVTMAFHAFFAVSLMSTDVLLQARYFSGLGLGIDALADQGDGAAIAWGVGEIPTLLLALLVGVEWARADGRANRRRDRAADRDGDAELARYNAMLAALRREDEA